MKVDLSVVGTVGGHPTAVNASTVCVQSEGLTAVNTCEQQVTTTFPPIGLCPPLAQWL